METVCVKFDNKFLKDMEKIIGKNRYSTKTEFIREAVREKMTKMEKEELLKNIDRLAGSSKRKTTDEQLHKVREKLGEELLKTLGFSKKKTTDRQLHKAGERAFKKLENVFK